MLRIIKNRIFILFLLAGTLFIIKDSYAQIYGGGVNNGFSSSKSNACSTPAAMAVSGGSYDGSSVIISNGCPRGNAPMAGGSNNGFSSGAANSCSSPTAMIVSGGNYDGSTVLV